MIWMDSRPYEQMSRAAQPHTSSSTHKQASEIRSNEIGACCNRTTTMTGEQQGDGPLLPPNPSGQEQRDEPLLPRSGNKPQEEEPQGNRRLAARTEARGRRRTGGRTTEGEAGDDRPQQAEMMRRRRRRSTGRRWGGRIRDLQIRRGQRRPRPVQRTDGDVLLLLKKVRPRIRDGRTAEDERRGRGWRGQAPRDGADGR